MQRARSDLCLVLENMRVLFGLVTMQPSRPDDDVAELTLVVARLGATANHQGATVDRRSAIHNH
jgi:hypothetical protein